MQDFALASAHLVLPALTSLCLTATDYLTHGSGLQAFLPYVAQHVHGPQDVRPLQSVLIRNNWSNLELLAWPVPDIDNFVHDPPTFLGTTLPTRVKLSFRGRGDVYLDIFERMMVALPLNGLLTLVAVDLNSYIYQGSPVKQFWLRLMSNWPLLRRVRLAHITLPGFTEALLEDCRNPLLPSLTELALAESTLDTDQTICLGYVLTKRAEQGVPLKTLDLRMCRRDPYNFVAVQSFREIAIDIIRPLDFLGPEDTEESRNAGHLMFAKMITMWEPFLPYLCYSSNEDWEFEESEYESDEDDEDDDNDNDNDDDDNDDNEDSNVDEYEYEEYDNDDDEDEDDGDYVPDDD